MEKFIKDRHDDSPTMSKTSTDTHGHLAIDESPDQGNVTADSEVQTGVDENGDGYVKGIPLLLVLFSTTCITFLMMLDMAIVVTAIPRITSDFHSLPDVGWYGSAYLLTSCAVQPLTGKLFTAFNSKVVYLTFIAIFELGSALCGAAQSSKMLIVGRAVAGLGTSGIMNGGLTIINASLPMHKRAFVLGIVISIAQVGVICGPLIGGALTQFASWRWCFYINLPIGAVASIFILLVKLPDHAKNHRSDRQGFLATLRNLDLAGFILFASSAVLFLLALQWGGIEYHWGSAMIIGLFCGSASLFAVFAGWEYHVGQRAMLPYSMIRIRIVWCCCLLIMFFFASMLVYNYYLPIYFQTVKGASPALSGVWMLPTILSQMLSSVVSGFLVGKLGYYLPWSVTAGIMTSVAVGLTSTFTPDTSKPALIGYQILAGLGRGCGLAMPLVAIQNALPSAQHPLGMSLIVFFQTFGGAIFLAFAQTIFNDGLNSGLKEYAPTVDANTLHAAGATALRTVIGPKDLNGVLKAYSLAIDHCFYLGAGCAVATFVFAWGIGWKKVSKNKGAVKKEETAQV